MENEKGFQDEYHIVELALVPGPEQPVIPYYVGVGTSDWKKYFRFRVYYEDGRSEARWIDETFRDYDHFANVFGKFSPYSAFFEEPLRSKLLYYDLEKVLEDHKVQYNIPY